MAETKGASIRQVTWNIPKELYTRFQTLHRWSRDKNFVGVPESEQDFAILMLDDAVSRGENVRDAYEKDGNLIIDPFAKARSRIEVRR